MKNLNLKIWGPHFLNQSGLDFLKWVPQALFKLMLSIGFVCFYRQILNQSSKEELSLAPRRPWLFYLGASWMLSLFWQVLIVFAAVQTTYWGWWTWLWSGAQQMLPPLWILTLGDTSFITLLILGLLAFGLSLSVRVGGIGLFFCASAIAAGVLSVWGALIIVLGERLGLWVTLGSWRHRFKWDLLSRICIALVFFIGAFVFGGYVLWNIRLLMGGDVWSSTSKLIEFAMLYAWWAAAETLVSLLFMHFYWQKIEKSVGRQLGG